MGRDSAREFTAPRRTCSNLEGGGRRERERQIDREGKNEGRFKVRLIRELFLTLSRLFPPFSLSLSLRGTIGSSLLGRDENRLCDRWKYGIDILILRNIWNFIYSSVVVIEASIILSIYRDENN